MTSVSLATIALAVTCFCRAEPQERRLISSPSPLRILRCDVKGSHLDEPLCQLPDRAFLGKNRASVNPFVHSATDVRDDREAGGGTRVPKFGDRPRARCGDALSGCSGRSVGRDDGDRGRRDSASRARAGGALAGARGGRARASSREPAGAHRAQRVRALRFPATPLPFGQLSSVRQAPRGAALGAPSSSTQGASPVRFLIGGGL